MSTVELNVHMLAWGNSSCLVLLFFGVDRVHQEAVCILWRIKQAVLIEMISISAWRFTRPKFIFLTDVKSNIFFFYFDTYIIH